MRNAGIKAIYTTDFKRTKQTVAPLASRLNLKLITYQPNDNAGFAKRILQDYKGKQVLVAGHSNTLIPLARAFGAAVTLNELTDEDYDMLFKVIIDKNGGARLNISHYGTKHHSTEIPGAYR